MFQVPREALIFRLLADCALLLSAPLLLVKLRKTGHDGVSLTTQILRLLVFVTRYSDLMTGTHISPYVDLIKVLVLPGTAATTFSLVHSQCRNNWEGCIPGARVRRQVFCLSFPCVILAILFNYSTSPLFISSIDEYMERINPLEIALSFSMFLSAVADLPQLRELQYAEEKDPLIMGYCLLLFAFRALYIPTWYFRFIYENMFDPISVTSGLVQTTSTLFYGFAIAMDIRRRKTTLAIQLLADGVASSLQDKKEKKAFV